MLRSLAGFKAQYEELTMLVVSEFDEWRVVVHSPAVVLQGQRQYGEAKAKEHALALVKRYIEETRQVNPEELPAPVWQPTGPQDWLVWKG
jgi:hypothetical protein